MTDDKTKRQTNAWQLAAVAALALHALWVPVALSAYNQNEATQKKLRALDKLTDTHRSTLLMSNIGTYKTEQRISALENKKPTVVRPSAVLDKRLSDIEIASKGNTYTDATIDIMAMEVGELNGKMSDVSRRTVALEDQVARHCHTGSVDYAADGDTHYTTADVCEIWFADN